METAVREKPILFSAPMVRAILAGRKTQTRRIVKHEVPSDANEVFAWNSDQTQLPLADVGLYARKHSSSEDASDGWLRFLGTNPYGWPGDRLWVRETWGLHDTEPKDGPDGAHVYFRATDGERHELRYQLWRPSIFMPRWASRLTLEITDIRVERLQEITEEDARAEGFDPETCEHALLKAAGKIKPVEAYNVEDDEGNDRHDGWLCIECATKLKRNEDYLGWGCTPEDDGPAFCEKCYKPLVLSLTEYGVSRELRIEDDPDGKEPQLFPCTGADAAVAAMIAGGIGSLSEGHKGRLAQIGFATLWEQLNGPRGFGWDQNPWVFVISFRRVEA